MKTKSVLLANLEAKNKEIAEIHDGYDTADQDYTTEHKKALDRLENEAQEIEAELKPILEREDARKKVKSRQDVINSHRLPQDGRDENEIADFAKKTFGNRFVKSNEFKGWLKQICPQGKSITTSAVIASPSVGFDGLTKMRADIRAKGLVSAGSTQTGAGALYDAMRLPLVNEGNMRILTVRDLVTIIPTESEAIEYPVITSITNNAGFVAETNVSTFTGAGGQVEGKSPESAMSAEVKKDRVKKISTWFPVTAKALLNARELESLLNTFLFYFLNEKSENAMIAGSGVGEEHLGILNTPGHLEQAFVTDIFAVTRKMRTKIVTQGKVKPTAYVLTAEQCEILDLARDGESRFFYGGPSEIGNRRLWGLPVIESEASASFGNKAVCGAWQFAALYDQEAGNVNITNGVNDFALRGLFAMIGEVWEGFGVQHPKAFCSGEVVAP